MINLQPDKSAIRRDGWQLPPAVPLVARRWYTRRDTIAMTGSRKTALPILKKCRPFGQRFLQGAEFPAIVSTPVPASTGLRQFQFIWAHFVFRKVELNRHARTR
jgi:hypothetical protein